MKDIDQLNQLLAELGLRYGIADLRLGAAGTAGLRLKDGTELFLQYRERQSRLYAYTPLIPVPRDDALQKKLFAILLDLNCLETGTGSGTLAVHPQQHLIIFQTGLDTAGLQLGSLDRTLHDLLASRPGLMQKLEQSMNADRGMDASPAPRRATSALLSARITRGK